MSDTRLLLALLSYGVAQLWSWEVERRLLADAKIISSVYFFKTKG
jgi:hypothetical protein